MSNGNYEYLGDGQRETLLGRESDTPWENSTLHRTQIMRMLLGSCKDFDQATLCVWGAGACNDIDVAALINQYSEVTLVDIDESMLRDAIAARQLTAEQAGHLHLRGGLDLSAVHDQLSKYKQAPADDKIPELVSSAAHARLPELGQFDVVISTCVLSQLIQHVVDCLGQDDPQRLAELVVTIRNRHLLLMLEHTRPGGQAILVSDVTSSDALPELARAPGNLDELFRDRILKGNHFHGLNPAYIDQFIMTDTAIQQRIVQYDTADPWIWNGSGRYYACLAYRMIKVT